MLKAQHRQLIQTTNSALVGLRSYEIFFFANLFFSFGIQCSVMANNFTSVYAIEVSFNSGVNLSQFWLWVFDISMAFGFVLSLFIIFFSTFITVWGNGLALFGPLGSMVKAVQGMLKEQNLTLICFSWLIFFQGINIIAIINLLQGWSVGTIVPSLIMMVTMYYWYYNSLKIYNRFKFDESVGSWISDGEEQKKNSKEDQDHQTNNTNPTAPTPPDQNRTILGLFSFFNSKKISFKDRPPNKNILEGQEEEGSTTHTPTTHSPTTHQGHLSMRVRAKASSPFGATNIENRFGVVRGSDLYFYADKFSFEKSPDHPIRKRPVPLEDFSMQVRTNCSPFELTLTPSDPEDDRAPITFLFSTPSDLAMWVEVFSRGIGGPGLDPSDLKE